MRVAVHTQVRYRANSASEWRVQVNFHSLAVRLHGITDTETFRGFMVQPRVSTAQFNSSAAHVGTFLVSADTQTLSCDGNSPVSAAKAMLFPDTICSFTHK